MPREPSPVMLEIVTVRDVSPVPETATRPAAVPVRLSATLVLVSVTASAPAYETVNVTGPAWVDDAEGALNTTAGAELSTVMTALEPAAGAWLPALSPAVPAASEMAREPSPVMLD